MATARNCIHVTWDTLGSQPFAVRVLAPDHPSTDYEHNFLFALPVEAWARSVNVR